MSLLYAATSHAQQDGKTLDTEIDYDFSPLLKVKGPVDESGVPQYYGFLMMKGKLNGYYDIAGGLNDYNTFRLYEMDVWSDKSNDFQSVQMDLGQSQLAFRGEHVMPGGERFVGYMEADFWNAEERMRLRHLWIDYKFIHIGQDWSNFGDKDIWPNVYDWDGPPSGVWRRNPMIQFYYKPAVWEYTFAFEFADPTIDGFNNPLDSNVAVLPLTVPDLSTSVRFNWKKNHIRLSGLYRHLRYQENSTTEVQPGYGVSLSGFINTKEETNPFQFQVTYGQSIGSYLVGSAGMNYDAYYASDQTFEQIPAFGSWVSYEHYFNAEWHANICTGYTIYSSDVISDFNIPDIEYLAINTNMTYQYRYILVNLMYDLLPNMNIGCEYNIGKKEQRYEGTIFTDNGTLSELNAAKWAQRISFGSFFYF